MHPKRPGDIENKTIRVLAYDREDIESRYEETMKKLGVKEMLRAVS